MAELSTEVAALKSKGSMFGYYNAHDVYYIVNQYWGVHITRMQSYAGFVPIQLQVTWTARERYSSTCV